MTYLTTLVIFLLGLYFIHRLTQLPVTIQLTVVAAKAQETEDESLPEAAMSADVLEYIEQESEEWARAGRKRRANRLFAQLQSWPEVLIELRKEDLNG